MCLKQPLAYLLGYSSCVFCWTSFTFFISLREEIEYGYLEPNLIFKKLELCFLSWRYDFHRA